MKNYKYYEIKYILIADFNLKVYKKQALKRAY